MRRSREVVQRRQPETHKPPPTPGQRNRRTSHPAAPWLRIVFSSSYYTGLAIAAASSVVAIVLLVRRATIPLSSSPYEASAGSFLLSHEWSPISGMDCQIGDISGANMGAQLAEHRRLSQPARLHNLTLNWHVRNWTEPGQFHHLVEEAGCCVMLRQDTGGHAPLESRIILSRKHWDELAENASNVIFNVDYSSVYWAMHRFYSIPDVFTGIRKNPILSLGTHGSGIFTHQHDENFLTQVQGTKVWFIAPPDTPKPPIRHPCSYLSQTPPPKNTLGVQACALLPGETLYLPERWHHATCNLGGEGAWGHWNLAIGGQGESSSWPASFHALADGDSGRLRQALHKTLSSLSQKRHRCSVCGAALWRELVALQHFAARAGSIDGLRIVLDAVGLPHSAPIVELDERDTRGGYGQIKGGTALHAAAWHGHLALVRQLVLRGADPGAELQTGHGSMHAAELASQNGYESVAAFLRTEEERARGR